MCTGVCFYSVLADGFAAVGHVALPPPSGRQPEWLSVIDDAMAQWTSG
jgi:hypothetical protein